MGGTSGASALVGAAGSPGVATWEAVSASLVSVESVSATVSTTGSVSGAAVATIVSTTTSSSGITISMTAMSSNGGSGASSETMSSSPWPTSIVSTPPSSVGDGSAEGGIAGGGASAAGSTASTGWSIGGGSSFATATELTRADPTKAPAAIISGTQRTSNLRMADLASSAGRLRKITPGWGH